MFVLVYGRARLLADEEVEHDRTSHDSRLTQRVLVARIERGEVHVLEADLLLLACHLESWQVLLWGVQGRPADQPYPIAFDALQQVKADGLRPPGSRQLDVAEVSGLLRGVWLTLGHSVHKLEPQWHTDIER